jgi:hypothetical protein
MQIMKHFFDSGTEWNDRDEARSAGEISELDIVEPEHEDEEEDEEEDMDEIYNDAVFN